MELLEKQSNIGKVDGNLCRYEKHDMAQDFALKDSQLVAGGNISTGSDEFYDHDGLYVLCTEPTHYCQVLWRFDEVDDGKTEVLLRGKIGTFVECTGCPRSPLTHSVPSHSCSLRPIPAKNMQK